MDTRRTAGWMRTSDRTWDIDERYGPESIAVSEPEEVYSGLLDANGNPLYRKRAPVGFLPSKS